MDCLQCGNCQSEESMFYCTAKNEFVIREGRTKERQKLDRGWKKGSAQYEKRRRDLRSVL